MKIGEDAAQKRCRINSEIEFAELLTGIVSRISPVKISNTTTASTWFSGNIVFCSESSTFFDVTHVTFHDCRWQEILSAKKNQRKKSDSWTNKQKKWAILAIVTHHQNLYKTDKLINKLTLQKRRWQKKSNFCFLVLVKVVKVPFSNKWKLFIKRVTTTRNALASKVCTQHNTKSQNFVKQIVSPATEHKTE